MTPEFIDRRRLKAEMRETVRTAQVSPRAMTALYLGICTVLNMIDVLSGGEGILSVFASILVTLVSVVLGAGFVMYVMAIVRGERAEFLSLLDGFSMAWGMFLAIPCPLRRWNEKAREKMLVCLRSERKDEI